MKLFHAMLWLVASATSGFGAPGSGGSPGPIPSLIIKGDEIPADGSGTVLVFSRGDGCSGTLMTNLWVLTAAHCNLDIDAPSNISVSMGADASTGAYAVNHPSLDFALIRLSTPFHMNGSTTGYRQPVYTGSTVSLNGQTLWCRGYGCNAYTSDGGCSGFGGPLRQAFLPVKPNAFDDYNFTVTANAGGQVLAPGDSGTGCFANTGQGWALAGINKAGSTAENYLGRPENWRPWASAYIDATPIPLPTHWFVYTSSHPTFLTPLLPNDYVDSYAWQPCPGGHDYAFTPTTALEAGQDFIALSADGDTVSLTGNGTTTHTGRGPLTVKITTNHTQQSTGLVTMPVQCSDLGTTPTFWRPLASVALKQIVAAPDPDGSIEVFGLNANGGLLRSAPMAPGDRTAAWATIGGHGLQRIVVGKNADGRSEVFAIGGNGSLYHVWKHLDGSWSGWGNLGRNDVHDVAVTNDATGALQAFVIGINGAVFRTAQLGPNGGWTAQWVAHGGHALTHVTAGQNADGRPELFAVGGNAALYHFWQWGDGTWSSWASLGRTDVLQVQVANEANGTLAALVRTTGGAVFRTAQLGPNGAWNAVWTPLWGIALQDIALARTADGRVQVFSVGGDARAYVTEEGTPNGPFQSWRSLDGGGFKALSAVRTTTQERVFGLESNGTVASTVM